MSNKCKTTREMIITYSGMYSNRWVYPPRHVMGKYLIAMHLSIWRHHDNIWRTLNAARCGSTGLSTCYFQWWKLHFIDKLRKMNKYLTEVFFFRHNEFYIDSIFLSFTWLLVRNNAVFFSLRTKDMSQKSLLNIKFRRNNT